MATLPTSGDWRGSKRALFPLWLMAAAFFIPSYRACSDEPLRSAAQFATDGWFEAAWVTPVFIFAALFAVLTTLSLRRGEVDRTARKLGLAALGIFSLSTIGFGAVVLVDKGGEWQWLAVAALTTLAGGALVRRARGHAPWQVWEHLLAAFVVIAAGTGPSIFLAGDLVSGGHSTGPGAWLFVGAQLVLWGVLGVSLVGSRLTATGRAARS